MSTSRILLTGFGGQGVVLAGHILGKAAALNDGREATLIQAYGPEARGGATLVQVTISSAPILYPYIESADVVVCMSQEGFTKYAPALRPGGALLIEEDLVRLPDDYPDQRVFGIPATQLAAEAGRKMVANIVMLGFLVAITGVVGRKAMEEAIRTSVPKGTEELNLGAFARGFTHGELLLVERRGRDSDAGGESCCS
ncbi:MAG TPA: 2-oxoacid:acceptor oxidoreductase family protein [Candidatus Methanoperedens sp.]|nr:2-oxoacid:acceptor oxidoreductase family protein [Candidatus Methanoperedens sp.]